MNWVKQSYQKDDSIIKKANKQRYYKIEATYGNAVKVSGIWANNLKEAREKAYFKFIDADNREVKENNFN